MSDLEKVVAVARSLRPDYGALHSGVPAPELPGGHVRTVPRLALRELFRFWRLDEARFGTPQWNPLGALIAPGSSVVLKPNWVVHENQSGGGLDCLVTHSSLIEAVLEYVALTRPGKVVVGDAPIQRCDFQALMAACGLHQLRERFRRQGMDLHLVDFRRTVLEDDGGARRENVRPLDCFTLFDLKENSLLEPLAAGGKFRVTVYNPDLLERAHGRGRHQYLVAREIVEADTVINLPKLKCHKKACITGALKNLIGINGNKEYLPHHRKGGHAAGGDCYAGRSWLKEQAEELLDRANRRPPGPASRVLDRFAGMTARCAHWLGADDNLEGSWHGNDTIWRTCLDLQRILRYGKPDGTLGAVPRRQVISITDAIVAGEGEGPLAPVPVAAGFVSGSLNPAAAEWVHARLMGFDPEKIPLLRHAFERFPQPLASFEPEEVVVWTSGGERGAAELEPAAGRPFVPPRGWEKHCELEGNHDRADCEPGLVA